MATAEDLPRIFTELADNAGATDRDLAKNIHAAVRELNATLCRAYDAGLHVEIDYIGRQNIGRAGSLRIYRATIERREVIS